MWEFDSMQRENNKTKQAGDRILDGSKGQEDPPKRMRQIIKEVLESKHCQGDSGKSFRKVSQMWERNCGGGQCRF